TRLIDLGIKPFLAASSVQAIMAQRLVRVLCRECKKIDESPDPRILKTAGFKPEQIVGKQFWKAVGCSHCNNTGYRGRQGIFEMLQMNTEMRELAFNRAGVSELRRAARASGMRTLLEDGQLKCFRGVTTPDEL